MKILHLAAGNRWTGAAAPAFAEVEALRAAGVDAHYAYVGGYKLEAKLKHHDFAHPIIEKAQNPLAFRRTLLNIQQLIERHGGFDFLHAHLTYDHWLARFAARERVRLARTFHAERVLRSDPFTRSLVGATDVLFVINDTFCNAAPVRMRRAHFTPPPLDLRQFTPDGADMRAHYGFAPDEKVVTVIGKLSQGRGFETAMETFALIRRERSDTRMMIIGHGEHRPALEAYSRALGIDAQLTWAGYHEDDLAEHYRASDALLFTARGSDEGHRAILEAMACALPPAVYPLAGMHALAGELAPQLVADAATPEALARRAVAVLAEPSLRQRVADRSLHFSYDRAAERLIEAYRARM